MARYDFTARRIYVDAALAQGTVVELARPQVHYLADVLRLPDGAEILAFNGRDGEWRCALAAHGRKAARLSVLALERPQPAAPDLHYLFAPLKHARLDYLIQKAVEMGAGLLQPVLTRHTHVERLNFARMQANAVEAAEQCGILTLPRIEAAIGLDRLAAAWPHDRVLVFCDEDAHADPLATLQEARADIAGAGVCGPPPLAVLIGPEGGFDAEERRALLDLPKVVRLSLGPRILRADTAAVAALALVQAVLGDWRS